jgi:malate synthase
MNHAITIDGVIPGGAERVFTRDQLDFVGPLAARFGKERVTLLARRDERRTFGFLPETEQVRTSEWSVASAPADLQKRHVEITGPVEQVSARQLLDSKVPGGKTTEAGVRNGRSLTPDLYRSLRDEEMTKIEVEKLEQAAGLLDELVLAESFVDFLTLPGYRLFE